MSDGGLFDPLFGDPDVDDLLDDRALLRAMLTFEAALAGAQADLGLIPQEAADAISVAARDLELDPAEIGRASIAAGNPANPLVRELTAAVPESARPFVHLGATSQDMLDSALMLCAKNACELMQGRLEVVTETLVGLVEAHRHTPMPARTLGQHALPTTFGRVAAGWLVAVDDAIARMEYVVRRRLAVQLGGAAGTLAGLDGHGTDVLAALAVRLDLQAPVLPWHTDRARVLDLAAALGGVVAPAGKIALNLVLLAQSEVAEVVPASGGGSTAMPHKANPTDAILVRSAAVRAPGLVATLFSAAGAHENERAAGAWHAEWEPLRELVSVAGGAVLRLSAALEGLRVQPERMRADLDLTGGLLMSESVAARLAPELGRDEAHELVRDCARRAAESGTSFASVLRDEPRARAVLDDDALAAALDPTSWTGATDAFIDRALAAHERPAWRNV